MGPGVLSQDAVTPHLHGRFGSPYLYEPECESTQALLLGTDLPEGAVAVAEHQAGGRGRLGRRWTAPPGSSVLVSVLLRPAPARSAPQLSLVSALAVAEAIDKETGLQAQVKWPNDVLLDGRKVAGILSELRNSTVVVGIGVNVGQTTDELPADAPTTPTSLFLELGATPDRASLLGAVLERLEIRYEEWRGRGLPALIPEIGSRDYLSGRRVEIDGRVATARRILPDGRLEVATEDGIHAIESGEVLPGA